MGKERLIMSSDFNSCNASQLGYYVQSPLGFRDAGIAQINLSAALVGVGHLIGKAGRHIIQPTGTGNLGNGYGLWTQQYNNGVAGPLSLGNANQPQGQAANNTVPQRLRRTILLYVVQPTDAAFVGQEVFMTVNVFVGAGSSGLNIYTSVPALSSSIGNAAAGTLVTTLAPINGIVTVDLGFTLPAVGSSFSIGAALVNDIAIVSGGLTGGNEQTTGNGVAGGSFYTVA